MSLKSLFVVFAFAFCSNVNASHIVGGDIFYNYLGNNNYEFHVRLYRDCLSTGATFDNPLYLTIYSGPGNQFVTTLNVPFPGSTQLPVVFNNPCVTPPTNICTEVAEYVTVINLPPTPGGYTISYQRCCRGPNITNLLNPDDTGLTLNCQIPGLETNEWANNSARFNNYPPLLLCNNEDLIFDHSATDPDGDQLVYSLVTPNSGASPIAPQPNTAPPPPYPPVTWAGAGFSAAQPLGPGSVIAIDPVTGLLTASPNLLGLFVVGIQVQEIRNGVVLNTTVRDFLFRVFNCDLQLESILPDQDQLATFVSYCQGLNVDFENDSYGGTNYAWDFGVPGITTDVSTAFEPSYTYPAPGDYIAMLVVNPGWPCTDTAYMDISVNNELSVSWTSQDSLCVLDNQFDFVANTAGGSGTTFSWDFGPNANIATATGQTVNNISFSTSGPQTVTVSAQIGVCQGDSTGEVYVLPSPTAGIDIPTNIECEGLSVSFGNSSINATNYSWDFGDGIGTSSDFDPTYDYLSAGTYTVTLEVWSTPACVDQVQETITVNDLLFVDFLSDLEQCATDNSFDFTGTVSGPPQTIYTWDFGSNASIQSSNDLNVYDVSFSTTGTVPVTLTGAFDNCSESVTYEIYLYSPPTIDFTIQPGLQCTPFLAQFIDGSWAETEIFYNWNFGDNTTSTDQNPTHLYPNAGSFPVSLTIFTDEGCIDTLTLLQADLVDVHDPPTAGFSVTPPYTDICASEIQMIDASEGAESYFYWFDDSTFFSNGPESNPSHQYLYAGSHYPMQVVTNEWGCKDTAYSSLFIEPFTLFVPNTFTPDGDQFNNTFEAFSDFYIDEWHLKIYNRWGQVLFESFDINTTWDGTFNGSIVQDGTYGYTIQYRTCEPLNPDREFSGHINVLR